MTPPDWHGAECGECHRKHDIGTMVRVISTDVGEEDFCDWECFKRYYDREIPSD